MINFIKRLFCHHTSYKLLSIHTINFEHTEIVKGTEDWFVPKFEKITRQEIHESFVCKNCGHIYREITV